MTDPRPSEAFGELFDPAQVDLFFTSLARGPLWYGAEQRRTIAFLGQSNLLTVYLAWCGVALPARGLPVPAMTSDAFRDAVDASGWAVPCDTVRAYRWTYAALDRRNVFRQQHSLPLPRLGPLFQHLAIFRDDRVEAWLRTLRRTKPGALDTLVNQGLFNGYTRDEGCAILHMCGGREWGGMFDRFVGACARSGLVTDLDQSYWRWSPSFERVTETLLAGESPDWAHLPTALPGCAPFGSVSSFAPPSGSLRP